MTNFASLLLHAYLLLFHVNGFRIHKKARRARRKVSAQFQKLDAWTRKQDESTAMRPPHEETEKQLLKAAEPVCGIADGLNPEMSLPEKDDEPYVPEGFVDLAEKIVPLAKRWLEQSNQATTLQSITMTPVNDPKQKHPIKMEPPLRTVVQNSSGSENDGDQLVWLWHATTVKAYTAILLARRMNAGRAHDEMPAGIYMASTMRQAVFKARHAFGGHQAWDWNHGGDVVFAAPVRLGQVVKVAKNRVKKDKGAEYLRFDAANGGQWTKLDHQPLYSLYLEYAESGGQWRAFTTGAEWIIGTPSQIDVEKSIPFFSCNAQMKQILMASIHTAAVQAPKSIHTAAVQAPKTGPAPNLKTRAAPHTPAPRPNLCSEGYKCCYCETNKKKTMDKLYKFAEGLVGKGRCCTACTPEKCLRVNWQPIGRRADHYTCYDHSEGCRTLKMLT